MSDLTSAVVPPAGAEDHIRGPGGRPVIRFYGDFTCVRCAVAALQLRDLGAQVAYRHVVLSARGPRGAVLARAAEAAAMQGAFWDFHDRLFTDQGHQDDPHLWSLCTELGLDLERFDADRRSDAVGERVTAQTRGALRGGVTATPTLVLADGAMHAGDIERGILEATVAG